MKVMSTQPRHPERNELADHHRHPERNELASEAEGSRPAVLQTEIPPRRSFLAAVGTTTQGPSSLAWSSSRTAMARPATARKMGDRANGCQGQHGRTHLD